MGNSFQFSFGLAVPMRGSTMQLSFSNKVSAIPQFLSFKSGVEEKPRKTTHDHISSGFSPISTADAFDSNQNPYSCMIHVSHCCYVAHFSNILVTYVPAVQQILLPYPGK